MHAAFENALKLLLAPVLIWQGLRVRKHALILPEPRGPRSGRTGTGPRLRLLILGDSSAAGVGVPTQNEALTGQLVGALAEDFTITWDLVARTGATTASTFDWVQKLEPNTFDAVVLAIGVNDVTRSVPLGRWINQNAKLSDLLIGKFNTKRIYTTSLPPMGQFTVFPQPLRWLIGLTAARYDRHMSAFQARRCEITRIRFALSADPAFMATDGYHPGSKFYAIWAQELTKCIKRDFAQETGGKPSSQPSSYLYET